MIGEATKRMQGVPWLFSGPVARLLDVLDADGEETRIVGGAVRNALLGHEPGDIDFASTALPEVTTRRAKAAGFHVVPTGIDHGTVTVLVDHHPFEVTTLREDIETFGRHATVKFGRDWRKDAERRDFTINALAVDKAGVVHDHVGGLADLAARRVRFIGDAGARVREDYLRILRFFRFHAGYGEGEPDAEALAACLAERAGLERLSRERIRAELLKLLAGRRAADACALMAGLGVLGPLLGGVPYSGTLARLAHQREAAGERADALLRLGALAVRIREDAERLGERLRLSRAETARLAQLDGYRALSPALDEQARRTALYRLGTQAFADQVQLAWATSGAPSDDAGWRDLLALPQHWQAPKLPFGGAELMARGVPAGPELGAALKRAEAAWCAAGFPLVAERLERLLDAAASASTSPG